jgi:hypothetical protein
MPNRLLTRDEVYIEVDALFERMGLKPPQRVVSDGETIGARVNDPSLKAWACNWLTPHGG